MPNDIFYPSGENTPQYVAYQLFQDSIEAYGKPETREKFLDQFAECLKAVWEPDARLRRVAE